MSEFGSLVTPIHVRGKRKEKGWKSLVNGIYKFCSVNEWRKRKKTARGKKDWGREGGKKNERERGKMKEKKTVIQRRKEQSWREVKERCWWMSEQTQYVFSPILTVQLSSLFQSMKMIGLTWLVVHLNSSLSQLVSSSFSSFSSSIVFSLPLLTYSIWSFVPILMLINIFLTIFFNIKPGLIISWLRLTLF